MALDLPSYLLGKKKGGGGGGTSDYSQLTNKPSINGVTLSGDKSTSDLGIQDIFYMSNSNQNPFVFNGKKKGMYYFWGFGRGFSYKLSDNTTLQSINNCDMVAIYIKQDFTYVEGQTNYDDVCGMLWFNLSNGNYYREEIRVATSANIVNGSISASSSGIGTLISSDYQIISGRKNFNDIPAYNYDVLPTRDTELVNKCYVDFLRYRTNGDINLYSSSTTYSANDMIYYTSDKKFYKCLQTAKSKAPSASPSYWQEITFTTDQLSLVNKKYVDDAITSAITTTLGGNY